MRQRYLVTLLDGDAFDGLLSDADVRHLILVDSEQVSASGERTKVDGALWIPRDRVAYMQQPKA
jgi:hypothetical protein